MMQIETILNNISPQPPFWGNKKIQSISLDQIIPYINKSALYKFQWGFKKKSDFNELEYKSYIRNNVDPILLNLLREERINKNYKLQAVYGYYPVQSNNNELYIYDYNNLDNILYKFSFPRQRSARNLCIADYFLSINSGIFDVVAFQIVTTGQKASDFSRSLFSQNKYQDYLYWHGLEVEATEGLAEFVHKRIRAELGFASEEGRTIQDIIKQKYRGSRYSFGYPACPNLGDQRMILDLLSARDIGIEISEEDQLWPENSTSAIVVYNQNAKYFGV